MANYIALTSNVLQLFQAGLKAYFEKFKYSNAKTEDLWKVLETTGVDDVADFMTLWTKQTGYPVVSVRLIHAPDGTYSIGVRQQRFLADGSSANGGSLFCWILFQIKLPCSLFFFICLYPLSQ